MKHSARHIFAESSGEGVLKLHPTGELVIEGLERHAAEGIADLFVNAWLIVDDT